MPDPVVPLDPDRLDAIEQEACALRWSPTLGEVMALVAAARKLDLMLSHESIYAECDALRAERDRLVVGKRKYRRERDALRAEVDQYEDEIISLRAEVERLRAMEALRMAADAAMCAEIATEGAPDE